MTGEEARPTCHHCGQAPDPDGDHSCPCPLSDSECLEHTLNPVVPTGEKQVATIFPGTAHGSDPAHHHIDGNQFVCSAPDDAKCRTTPTCDCEFWCCDDPEDHDPGEHCCMATVKTGQGCWLDAWVNAPGLDESFDHYGECDPSDYDTLTGEKSWPDGPVACDWEDDSVIWRYVPTNPPRLRSGESGRGGGQ